eukprot:6714017-Prymnesium_polylepis.1
MVARGHGSRNVGIAWDGEMVATWLRGPGGHLLGAPHANVVRVVDLGRRPLALPPDRGAKRRSVRVGRTRNTPPMGSAAPTAGQVGLHAPKKGRPW